MCRLSPKEGGAAPADSVPLTERRFPGAGDRTVVGVGTLVDRSDGKVDFGIPLKSLLRLQVQTFDPTACPLCEVGMPVVKPGS